MAVFGKKIGVHMDCVQWLYINGSRLQRFSYVPMNRMTAVLYPELI